MLALREMFRAWNERRPRESLALLDEYIIWDTRGLPMTDIGRVYVGPDDMREFWRNWLPQWSDIQVEIAWIEARGDRVIAWVHQELTGEESGVTLGFDYAWDTSWRDGRLIRASFTDDEAEARRWAGIE